MFLLALLDPAVLVHDGRKRRRDWLTPADRALKIEAAVRTVRRLLLEKRRYHLAEAECAAMSARMGRALPSIGLTIAEFDARLERFTRIELETHHRRITHDARLLSWMNDLMRSVDLPMA